MSLALVYTNSF